MRFAIYVPCFGAFADARTLADLAHAAEDTGWDGFFVWDHILAGAGVPMADPWIALAAMAMRTERIRLGALVTPLPRRRPWKVAREAVTLDHLSGGRLTFGAGIGGDWEREYSAFGEPADDRAHAVMLDEALDILTGLWRGEPFSHDGEHYHIRDVTFLPKPLQEPRIPIWIAGVWPHKAPFRRAARFDGVAALADERQLTPADVREMMSYIHQHRPGNAPFDVATVGFTGDMPVGEAANLLADYADAGVTWWQEGFWPDSTVADARARIQQGPPKLPA
jgi:alkanesulfonate monooxygenase SsuD/methylene tetrahydromethanopterin reductase-like flavin-dependent oxidoreductase (luciferase family)